MAIKTKKLTGEHLTFEAVNKDSKIAFDLAAIRKRWPLGKTEFEKWLDKKEKKEKSIK